MIGGNASSGEGSDAYDDVADLGWHSSGGAMDTRRSRIEDRMEKVSPRRESCSRSRCNSIDEDTVGVNSRIDVDHVANIEAVESTRIDAGNTRRDPPRIESGTMGNDPTSLNTDRGKDTAMDNVSRDENRAPEAELALGYARVEEASIERESVPSCRRIAR